MKKTGVFLLLITMIMVLLSGCSGAKYEITSSPTKMTIKVNDTDKDAYAETDPLTVKKGKVIQIDSSLEKGKLQIEFAEAINISSDSGHYEYTPGKVFETMIVSPGDKLEYAAEPGEYMLLVTTLEKTSGEVQIAVQSK